MKKLSKKDLEQLGSLSGDLEIARDDLEAAIEEYNQTVSDAFDALEAKLEPVADAISEAISFRDDIAGQIAEYISERSEKWQESDKGQEFQEWQNTWEQFEFGDLELERPEPLEMPEIDVDAFRELPEEPGGGW